MKSIAISGSLRGNVGKRDSKELRYQGLVPAVLYGGKEQVHLAVSAADLRALTHSADALFVDLTVDGKQYKAIAQEIQFHPLNEQVRHIDFLQLFDDKYVSMNIPIKLTGISPGVRAGGKLAQKLRSLRIKALPNDLPQYVEVNIGHLEVGKSVRVNEIKIDNVKILNNSDDTIVAVGMSRALRQAEQEAANAAKV